jgi:hypothetical protein
VLTLEASSNEPPESPALRSLSPLADNAVLLRYVELAGGLRPTLTVLKTRASMHSFDTHYLSLAKGGVAVGARIEGEPRSPQVGRAMARGAPTRRPKARPRR